MSATAPDPDSAELSLINGAEFLDELARFASTSGRSAESGPAPPTAYHDAYGALETGLSVSAGEHHAGDEPPPFQPVDDPYADDEPVGRRDGAETDIPFFTAVIVLVACLSAGAIAAAVVYHDRLTTITATR